MIIHNNDRRIHSRRRGAAAVEAALVLPLLVIVTLGAIDLAQYINLSQLVTNASREGARLVSRSGNESTKEVEDAVRSYMADSLPQLSPAKISEAMKITIQDKNNQPVQDGDLTKVEPGDPISIQIAFDFSAVRWLHGPNWNGNTSQCRTVCRRE